MKPVDIGNFIGLDRLATWNEVTSAISVSAERTFAFVRDCSDLREADSDFSLSACNPAEDNIWLAIACKMSGSKIN